MKRKNQKLLPEPLRPPELESGEEEVRLWDTDTVRKQKKDVRVQTVICGVVIVLLIAAFVILAVGGSRLRTALGNGAGAVSSFLLGQDFRNISGDAPDSGDDDGQTKRGFFEVIKGFLTPGKDRQDGDTTGDKETGTKPGNSKPTVSMDTLYQYDYSKVGEGEIPIIPMDLSLCKYGPAYIHNATGYKPDTAALLAGELKKTADFEYLASTRAPLVLIVHTHATESYSEDGAISYREGAGDFARTSDIDKNMIAAGNVLAESLEKAGIATAHCTVLHDQVQYKDSYARSEESIRQYLAKYPTIRLVIDLHRDSVTKSTGELVRPVTAVNGKAAAQVMCVVGSDWKGEACPNWQGNLALALKLGDALNTEYGNLCRPTSLKGSTYNQELAPYSLLIELGSSGNSLEEAKYSAELVAGALARLIPLL